MRHRDATIVVAASTRRILCAALVFAASAAHANGVNSDDFLARLITSSRAEMGKLVASRAPKLVRPVPAKIAWKPTRLGSLDLGALLVTVEAGDLDGDGKGELYAVTQREVIAIGLDKRAKILARVPYTGEPSARLPRDLFGTAVIDGTALVAKCSGWAQELRVSWSHKQLSSTLADATGGNLVCKGERLLPVPGRNHFGDVVNPIYDVRCRTDLVDPEGHPLAARATLAAGKLLVASGDKVFELNDYGVAFALGDVDRDGKPEIVVTGANPPGDPDAVKVMTLGGDEKRGLFRKAFQGGVAGVAIVDGDGDGVTEVIAVVRLVGSPRVDIWRLD
jgi:hypothetical protein